MFSSIIESRQQHLWLVGNNIFFQDLEFIFRQSGYFPWGVTAKFQTGLTEQSSYGAAILNEKMVLNPVKTPNRAFRHKILKINFTKRTGLYIVPANLA